MKFTKEQDLGLQSVNKWYLSRPKRREDRVFRFFGYAGTGKTTLARHFADNLDGDVCYAAFTGKAALMMRKNGCHNAKTIHSLIYKATEHEDGTVTYSINPDSEAKHASLIVIDECSMVNKELADALLSFGKPILVLGDPAQLPPVEGNGYFTDVEYPDYMLTEIHRQARDNPIIDMATRVRQGHQLRVGNYGNSMVISKPTSTAANEADQILTGRNATRTNMNSRLRKMRGYTEEKPMEGERLICLKNDSQLQIMNGGMFTVSREIRKTYPTHFLHYALRREDEPDTAGLLVKVHKSLFVPDVPKPDWRMLKGSQEFDYGYAITVHKAQGSQWETVMIYDESYCFRDDSLRWLYTALTRAQERVIVVKS